MIYNVIGDIFNELDIGDYQVLIHGCNCFNSMGKGIALSVKNKYPPASYADSKTMKGSHDKLGTYSHCVVDDLVIINAYTQYAYGRTGKFVSYPAIRNIFKNLSKLVPVHNKIIMPRIGAGLGGGDWQVIKDIITDEMPFHDITVVTFDRTKG